MTEPFPQHACIHYLTREDVKDFNINHVYNIHKKLGGEFFSVPGEMIQKLWVSKPTTYHGCQSVQCDMTGDWFLELIFVAPTGRLITLTGQGYDLYGEQYLVDPK